VYDRWNVTDRIRITLVEFYSGRRRPRALFFVELPFAVLNTFFGAFAIALGLAAVEFFVIKNVMT